MDTSPLHTQPSGNNLELNEASLSYLNETRKWAMFISIVVFVMCGLLVFAGLLMAVAFSAMPNMEEMPFSPAALTLIYVIMGGIYFLVFWYLYRFSSSLGTALLHRRNESLTEALGNLKSHYKAMGILLIVVLGCYLVLIAVIMVMGVGSFMGNSVNA